MSEVVIKELPENWVFTPLSGLLIEFETGTRPKGGVGKYTEGTPSVGAEHLDANGGFKFKKIKFVPEEYANSMLRGHLEEGDILVVKDGATTAKTSLIRKSFPHPDAVINEHVFRCKVAEGIEPKYVFYYLFSGKGQKEILSDFRGAAQGGITKGFADKVNIPLAPPEQQKCIVAKIEELFSHIDAGIVALNKAKQLLKQYRQSVLKAAVTGELTKEWRESNKNKFEPASQLLERILKERRQKWEEQQLKQFKAKSKMPKDDRWKGKYKEPVSAIIDELPEIPNEWVWATLPQLGELNRGKSKHRPRNDPSLYGGDYPFVQTGDVRAANTWLKEYSKTYSDKGLNQSRLWPKGTMCITIAANIADTAILDLDACFPDSVVGFIPLNDSVNVEVIEFFIRTVKNDLEKYAPATAQKNINLAILEAVAIPLLPVDEQVELINSLKYKMSMADRLEEEIDSKLIVSDKNKQSILTDAFSGKLVKPMQTDESASLLLERIQEKTGVINKQTKSAKKKSKKIKEASMRKAIIDVLKEENEPIETSVLMQKAGFEAKEVEDFYYELGEIADQIKEVRPSKSAARNWPYKEAVNIRLRK